LIFLFSFALSYTKDIGTPEDVDVKVYMITHSGSQRVYIGVTRKTLNLRLSAHKSRAKNLKKHNLTMSFKDRWLIDAIEKGHVISIHEIDVVKFSEFSFWEKHYISLFKMFGFKLTNGTEGGDGCWPRRISDEEKEAIKRSKYKPVVEYNINGDVINKYDSLKQTSELTGLNYARLSHSVAGKKKLCDGRMFRYQSISVSDLDIKKCFEERNKEKRKAVIQFDLSGNFVAEYKSASHTPFDTPTQKSAIAKACRGECKTKYGFIWKYKD
jgi:hypothetical protein